eukprot:2312081-Rhodomonas_salina.2
MPFAYDISVPDLPSGYAISVPHAAPFRTCMGCPTSVPHVLFEYPISVPRELKKLQHRICDLHMFSTLSHYQTCYMHTPSPYYQPCHLHALCQYHSAQDSTLSQYQSMSFAYAISAPNTPYCVRRHIRYLRTGLGIAGASAHVLCQNRIGRSGAVGRYHAEVLREEEEGQRSERGA